VGCEGIINLCPLRAFFQRIFPASLNFSPDVWRKIIKKEFLKGLVSGSVGYVPFLWNFIYLHKVKTVGNTLGNARRK